MRLKPKPGSSEVYKILVPCALTPGGKHEIELHLRYDKRLTIESPCLARVASAHDKLMRSGNDRVSIHDLSCGRWINHMYDAVRARVTSEFMLLFCTTCAAHVPGHHDDCPFQIFDEDTGPTHHVDRHTETPGFWNRVVRTGRVPYRKRSRRVR